MISKPKSYDLTFYEINFYNNVANVFLSHKYEGATGTLYKRRSNNHFRKKIING